MNHLRRWVRDVAGKRCANHFRLGPGGVKTNENDLRRRAAFKIKGGSVKQLCVLFNPDGVIHFMTPMTEEESRNYQEARLQRELRSERKRKQKKAKRSKRKEKS